MDTPDTPLFVRACLNQPVERTPVWFMRQAGRALPEYREKRGTGSILETVKDPELAAELTLQPVTRYKVDAAVLFSDIMVPLNAIGVELDILANVGPVIFEPFTDISHLSRIRRYEPEEDAPYVQEAIRLLVKTADVPVLGFAGGPFTMASYLVEGKPTRTFAKIKALMHQNQDFWFLLMDKLSELVVASLSAQISAGAAAIQLFDSWAGYLSRYDYEKFVWPFSKKIFAELSKLPGPKVPKIHFGVGTGAIIDLMASAGADVISVDWRLPIDKVRQMIGRDIVIQGNLDPAICLAPFPVVAEEAGRILKAALVAKEAETDSAKNDKVSGHIFNLGHGVLPETDPDTLSGLVEFVREKTGHK